jgi:hypothetical protein
MSAVVTSGLRVIGGDRAQVSETSHVIHPTLQIFQLPLASPQMQTFTRDQVRLQALDAQTTGSQAILVIFNDMVLSLGGFSKHHP